MPNRLDRISALILRGMASKDKCAKFIILDTFSAKRYQAWGSKSVLRSVKLTQKEKFTLQGEFRPEIHRAGCFQIRFGPVKLSRKRIIHHA